jgi:hypothetical protein
MHCGQSTRLKLPPRGVGCMRLREGFSRRNWIVALEVGSERESRQAKSDRNKSDWDTNRLSVKLLLRAHLNKGNHRTHKSSQC